MKLRIIIISLILMMINFSCLRKTKCDIQPMKSNIIDSTQLKGNFIFKSKSGLIDTLELIDYHNVLKNISKKSLLTMEECEHSLGFNYNSSTNKGSVSICLKKNKKSEYLLSINGFCVSEDIIMNQSQVEKDSIIIIEINECVKSEIKTLAIRKCRLEYFITKDKEKWEITDFIPSAKVLYQ